MKYVLLDDIKHIIGKNKKIIFSYFVVLVLLLLGYMFLSYTGPEEIPTHVLGLDLNFNKFNWLEMLSYVLSLSIYIILSIKLFIKDMASNSENIFLRISKKKWVSYKLLSIICCTILYMLVCYFLIFVLIYAVKNILLVNVVSLYLKNLIYMLTFEVVFLFIYCIALKQKWALFLIVLLLIVVGVIYLNIYSVINIKYSVFCPVSVLLYIFIYKFLLVNIASIFELIKEK